MKGAMISFVSRYNDKSSASFDRENNIGIMGVLSFVVWNPRPSISFLSSPAFASSLTGSPGFS
jgi:hypothetical protein